MPIPRRLRLLPLALLISTVAALAAAPGAGAAAKGFKYGVAAGDVNKDSAILWARANKAGKTEVQVTGKRFEDCDIAHARFKAKATKDNDLTVQKRVTGLRPGKTYKYRFCMAGGKHSSTGTFETAPKPGQAKTYWNNFGVWKQIKAEKNDVNVMMGDTIYSDTEVPGYGLSNVAT